MKTKLSHIVTLNIFHYLLKRILAFVIHLLDKNLNGKKNLRHKHWLIDLPILIMHTTSQIYLQMKCFLANNPEVRRMT